MWTDHRCTQCSVVSLLLSGSAWWAQDDPVPSDRPLYLDPGPKRQPKASSEYENKTMPLEKEKKKLNPAFVENLKSFLYAKLRLKISQVFSCAFPSFNMIDSSYFYTENKRQKMMPGCMTCLHMILCEREVSFPWCRKQEEGEVPKREEVEEKMVVCVCVCVSAGA